MEGRDRRWTGGEEPPQVEGSDDRWMRAIAGGGER